MIDEKWILSQRRASSSVLRKGGGKSGGVDGRKDEINNCLTFPNFGLSFLAVVICRQRKIPLPPPQTFAFLFREGEI